MGLELGFFVPPVPPEQYIKMALRAEEVGYENPESLRSLLQKFDNQVVSS